MVAGLLAGTVVGVPATSQADLQVTVRITVERIEALDSIEEPGDADWYVVATIDGQERSTDQESFTDQDVVDEELELSAPVALSRGSVPVRLELWDDDDGFLSVRGDDDQADIVQGGDRSIDLTVSLAPCSVGGELVSPCGTSITSQGDSGDDNARIRFRVQVDEPVSAPGLNVRCLHTPLLPAAGDMVEVTVQALDGALAPDTVVAEQLELWTDNSGPAQTSSGNDDATFTFGPVTGPFTYGCRVVDEGVPVFTGFRRVGLAGTAGLLPVPLLYTGPPSSRIDLVLIADRDSYTSPESALFQTDAAQQVSVAFHDFLPFLTRQDRFNFWLAPGLGDAVDAEAEPRDCNHLTPPGYDLTYGFADSGILLHRQTGQRDCAPGDRRLFSTEDEQFATTRHEAGHRPFGLADEYCYKRPGSSSSKCDGGYFQSDERPNVYTSEEDCQDDSVNLGRPAEACTSWESDRDEEEYWTSEPVGDDLMVDNRTPRAADSRRIDWLLDACTSAKC